MVFYVLSFCLFVVSRTLTQAQAIKQPIFFPFAAGVLAHVQNPTSRSLPFTIYISIDFPAFCGIISPSILIQKKNKLG